MICSGFRIWHVSGFTWFYYSCLTLLTTLQIRPFFRLFIYSLTRIFVPYYTGQVIASVVSTSGEKYSALLDAVKLMLWEYLAFLSYSE